MFILSVLLIALLAAALFSWAKDQADNANYDSEALRIYRENHPEEQGKYWDESMTEEEMRIAYLRRVASDKKHAKEVAAIRESILLSK